LPGSTPIYPLSLHDALPISVRDRGLFLMAEAQYRLGDRIKAFYYLDELLDTFPESPLFFTALNRQYDIADKYLTGAKRRVLFFRSEERRVGKDRTDGS